MGGLPSPLLKTLYSVVFYTHCLMYNLTVLDFLCQERARNVPMDNRYVKVNIRCCRPRRPPSFNDSAETAENKPADPIAPAMGIIGAWKHGGSFKKGCSRKWAPIALGPLAAFSPERSGECIGSPGLANVFPQPLQRDAHFLSASPVEGFLKSPI